MKRYKVLICVTLFLTFGIIILGNVTKSQIKIIDTLNLFPCTAESFVVCSGKIEYSNKQDVFLKSPCVIDDVYVKVGDKVSRGDNLLKVKEIDNHGESNYSDQALQQVYGSMIKQNNWGSKLPKEQFKEIIISSPISGIVSCVQVATNLPADSKIAAVTISDSQALCVTLNVSESRISEIKVGQRVEVSGVGFKGIEYTGTVKSISNEARSNLSPIGQETTVEVIVDINADKNDKVIKPGFTAKCKIITEELSNTIVVPYESVKSDEDGQEYVFTVNGGKAEKTYIKTGRELESGFELISGLSHKDIIISNPESIKINDNVRAK